MKKRRTDYAYKVKKVKKVKKVEPPFWDNLVEKHKKPHVQYENIRHGAFYYPLPITHYPLPITHYPLPITHYPLPMIYEIQTVTGAVQ